MNYLLKTPRTEQFLNQSQHKFTLIGFFFDFRARDSVTNNLLGLVKSFLTQLSKRFPNIEKNLAEQNQRSLFRNANADELEELLRQKFRSIPLRICAFIDGLDEYKGDYLRLGEFLIRIQHYADLKMCLASRSESAFQECFEGIPRIRMQDYNGASIQVYIDQAIKRGRATLIDVDFVLDEPMRREILQRARGVIIWARFAVDELLKSAESRLSRTELYGILTQLPEDLEEMYVRNLERLPTMHRVEAALLLHFITGIGNGSLYIDVLHGLWDFFADQLPSISNLQAPTDCNAFKRRLNTLLGSFIDIVESKRRGRFEFLRYELKPAYQVLLIHETLQSFLSQSAYLQSLLPVALAQRFRTDFKLKVYAEVIKMASQEKSFDNKFEIFIEWISSRKTNDFIKQQLQSFTSSHAWKLRVELLAEAIANFPTVALLQEKTRKSSYDVVKEIMSCDLIILAPTAITQYTVPTYQTPHAWADAKAKGYADIVLAIKHGLALYLSDWLRDSPRNLSEQDWNTLLVVALSSIPPSVDDSFYWDQSKAIISLIRARLENISPDVLMACIHIRRLPSDNQRFLANMLLSMSYPPRTELSGLVPNRDPLEEREYNDLLGCWMRLSYPRPLAKVLLHIIIQVGANINAINESTGSLLYDFMIKWKRFTDLRGEDFLHIFPPDFSKFLLMVKLGADPQLGHRGSTSIRIAKGLYRRDVIERIFRPGFAQSRTMRALRPIVQVLKYHEKHGKWPDLSYHIRQEPEDSMARWKMNESHQIILDENDIDRCGLD